MSLTLATAPSGEPISTATAKAHLRVDTTADDTLIGSLITAARLRIDGRDGFLGRALLTQTWDLWLDAFPGCEIRLPLAPAQSVTHVKYTDTDGVLQTLDTALWQLDTKSTVARLLPAYNEVWPSTRAVPNAVNIRFVAGYGAASDVPQAIIQHLLLVIGHWYENRGAAGAGIPAAIDAMVMPYRVWAS